MSHHSSANTAAIALLRIGFIVTALFTTLFLVLTQLQNHAAGKPLAAIIALTGLIFLLRALRDLLRELSPENSRHRSSAAS
ncbi:MAG: hypothetical protein ACRERR_13280 [Moraxellaceae bacterium]